jgi:methyltransferase (TIGR00027 family)
MSSPIQDVSDTAFWIAYHRKLETDRSDALFRDPFAARLAGERGRKISEAMPTSKVVAWTVAIRTRIIDEFLELAINSGVDTVLSLGAGLDARAYRLKLPESLQWIEADYPHMIDYKASQLDNERPCCRLERVKIDLADRGARGELFARVAAQAREILVLTEGVVPYLNNDEVASLADDLRATINIRYWILDYFSPEAMKYRKRKTVDRAMANAPFKFEPADWFVFFKQHGWQPKDVRYFSDEADRYRRPLPLPLYLRLLSTVSRYLMPAEKWNAMRRFAGYVMLEPIRSR